MSVLSFFRYQALQSFSVVDSQVVTGSAYSGWSVLHRGRYFACSFTQCLNDRVVPSFHETVSHACIDAGADLFLGHGPHLLRGIEIYDGAPIFYSLGNFMMQNETVTRLPTELYERYDLDSDATPADLFDTRVFDKDMSTCLIARLSMTRPAAAFSA